MAIRPPQRTAHEDNHDPDGAVRVNDVSKREPLPERPPSFLSRASLAAELDCCESTVDELVRRGVLPKPLRMSSGCVRWSWKSVELALAALAGTSDHADSDPFSAGVRHAAKITREGNRGAA